jgi:hypothetical protein
MRFGPHTPDHSGFSNDLSIQGLSFTSSTSFLFGEQLNLIVRDETHLADISLRGIIRWNAETGGGFANSDRRFTMGVSFLKRSKQYENLLFTLIENNQKNLEPRFPDFSFNCIYPNLDAFMFTYLKQIELGHLFVETDHPAPNNEIVQIRVLLGDVLKIISFSARVSNSVSPSFAEYASIKAGMKVDLLEPIDLDRDVLPFYIEDVIACYDLA